VIDRLSNKTHAKVTHSWSPHTWVLVQCVSSLEQRPSLFDLLRILLAMTALPKGQIRPVAIHVEFKREPADLSQLEITTENGAINYAAISAS
jgi:hypothetical protein